MTGMIDAIIEKVGIGLAKYLQKTSSGYRPFSVIPAHRLRESLKPGDILLVEGNQHISVAIKYLTQSTWSHSALYVGDAFKGHTEDENCLIEADMAKGVIAVPLSKYASFNTRICRPVDISEEDRRAVVQYAVARLGMQYDVRNAIDLVRYLLPQPPVPVRWRRRMLAFGGGDPTRAICSTLIAGAFESIGYPILPEGGFADNAPVSEEVRHIQNSRLYAPRDFDISPYFEVIKPGLHNRVRYARGQADRISCVV